MRLFFITLLAAIALGAGPVHAFCGFFVAKADASLFNEASKVVMMRDQDRTVITMVNDFQGDLSEFAMVIPAPTVLQRDQIHVTDNAIVDHLDVYTAPRLVEYFDGDPCARHVYREGVVALSAPPQPAAVEETALGVTIEASYTVGEYDILILSAEQSEGLQTWLTANGYKTPPGAGDVLADYIRAGMKFFVAKINLEEHAKAGGGFLRPLQIAFESENFMLPIRLGMLNAKGQQELLIFMLTRSGRVETANYRTVKIPSDKNVPLFVADEFPDFYRAMFQRSVEREKDAVLLEYAWDMAWCDPCAADPLSGRELRELGVYWVDVDPNQRGGSRIAPPQAADVFVTRLHARYDHQTFPNDLVFRETGDRENFQGRYIMNHPFKGELSCSAGDEYRNRLVERYEREAKTLANLTGWDVTEIRAKMAAKGQDPDNLPEPTPWWKRLWDE